MEKPKSSGKESEFLPSFLINRNQLDDAELTNNGLFLNNVYMPEEIILYILCYIEPKELLNLSLVCSKWNNLIKSFALWSIIYKRKYNRKPKKLPWYLYYCLVSTNHFNRNLLLNGNGQDKLKNWKYKGKHGYQCIIEDPPDRADPLPLDIPEFYDKTSCFAPYCGLCHKVQHVDLRNSKLFQYILDNYKPHIYLSEWVAPRFDCDCIYKLQCGFVVKDMPKNSYIKPHALHCVQRRQRSTWEKIEITVTEYPEGVEAIMFEHAGCHTQFYGCKMAGGVIKLLFDTIEPLPTDEDGNEERRSFSEVRFITHGNYGTEDSIKYIYTPFSKTVRHDAVERKQQGDHDQDTDSEVDDDSDQSFESEYSGSEESYYNVYQARALVVRTSKKQYLMQNFKKLCSFVSKLPWK